MEETQQVSADGSMTSAQIKWIAIITMLIDHIGASLLEWYIAYMPAGGNKALLRDIDTVLRTIGRLAFPLFIFLMVEGFFYTHSRRKYLLRLTLFAALSDFPFDLAFFLRSADVRNHVWWSMRHQNVFFTLAIGFAGIWLIETLRPKQWEATAKSVAAALGRVALCVAVTWGACRLADLLHTDYSWKGVLAMIVAYLIRLWGRTDLEIFGMVAILLFSSRLELAAIADYGLIRRYYGEKGKTINRWFFYLFYPGHLLILGVIRVLFILPK